MKKTPGSFSGKISRYTEEMLVSKGAVINLVECFNQSNKAVGLDDINLLHKSLSNEQQ